MAAGQYLADRVLESSTSTGTGTFTLAGAITGYQTFAVVGNGNTCPYSIWAVDSSGIPSGQWETGIGTYTSSGTTLARTTVIASSTGSAVNFSAGTKRVALSMTGAYVGTAIKSLCQGRLTLTTGMPVTTADVASSTSVFFAPYAGNQVSLFDGTSTWKPYTFTQLTLALGTLTSGKNYDVFLYDGSGTLTLEATAWTSDTARATALTTQDGELVKTGATARRYLGTFRTISTTTTTDSVTQRYLWNYYNRVGREMRKEDATSHTYSDAGTYRWWNNTNTHFVSMVIGWDEDAHAFGLTGECRSGGYMTLWLDGGAWSTRGQNQILVTGASAHRVGISTYQHIAVGYHTIGVTELGSATPATFNLYRMDHCIQG